MALNLSLIHIWYYQYQKEALCILLCKASHSQLHTQNPDIHPEKNF